MTKDNESSTPKTNIIGDKNRLNLEIQPQLTSSPQITLNNISNKNPLKRQRQQSMDYQSSPPIYLKSIETQEIIESKQLKSFPPYSISLKNSPHAELSTDRKLIEHLIVEWKNKNGTELDITGRYGHENCLLVFANNESSFEDLYCQTKWPSKLANVEFTVKIPRILPAAYSLVIHQFFNSWSVNEVLEELKTNYPSLINLTRMKSGNNKPLNLVRADFCSLKQCKRLLQDGRITIGHMKNPVKQYYPPARINKCMKCFSHLHNTKECTSSVQLCIRCGIDHPYNNNCQNEIKCANCGQDHYAGHSSCPEVQQIRKQISINQRIKRSQLLINQEQSQQSQFHNSEKFFPPLPSTPIQNQQGQNQHHPRAQPLLFSEAVKLDKQKTTNKSNQQSNNIENLLAAFTNKIDYRLQQIEERVINQVIELEKKIDNIKSSTNELEATIYETILPAIKCIHKFCLKNTRNNPSSNELTKFNNEISGLLSKRNIQTNSYVNNTSMEINGEGSNRQTRSSTNKSKTTTTTTSLSNDSD